MEKASYTRCPACSVKGMEEEKGFRVGLRWSESEQGPEVKKQEEWPMRVAMISRMTVCLPKLVAFVVNKVRRVFIQRALDMCC